MTRIIILMVIHQLIFSNLLLAQRAAPGQPVYRDTVFDQRYSVRFISSSDSVHLKKVLTDRNGATQVLSSAGLLKPSGGALLHPGHLVADRSYRPMTDRAITDFALWQDQFIYLDAQSVLSNAWAGKPYALHHLTTPAMIGATGPNSFLVAAGTALEYLRNDSIVWKKKMNDSIVQILTDPTGKKSWLLTGNSIYAVEPETGSVKIILEQKGLTSIALTKEQQLITGTHHGYFILNAMSGARVGEVVTRTPCTDISVVRIIQGKKWFGSPRGAFMQRVDGKFDYFASERWLPSDEVIDIAAGDEGTTLILTTKGLAQIRMEKMTLASKAAFFEQQVRSRHIRNGFNATISRMINGDPDSGILEDSDNDGLWTSMYLASEVFRYVVTRAPDALQNCRESLDAMERLYTINPVKGFPARSFERSGYELADRDVWRKSTQPGWDWKPTTSSDEAIGHIFIFGAMAELIADPDIRNRSIRLIDTLMQHIVDHDLYLVDWNGKPTRWGRWNPEYVNLRPPMVGDRKITSSNIIAMLQTAWHFTHKSIYRDKAFDLMNKKGYLTNLMKLMKEIGEAPADADELSRLLSDGWNHSDDEMYFLGYWGLYRYALNDTLKSKFREAIIDHWEAERPEKEAAWNIVTAMTGVKNFDLTASVEYLQRYPLDLIDWKVTNSHREDIDTIPANFRRQTIREVLPPDELPINRHNANLFELDGGSGGRSENSAGDIWLFPYWMARYLGVISAPTR